jgi:hypothetical protein
VKLIVMLNDRFRNMRADHGAESKTMAHLVVRHIGPSVVADNDQRRLHGGPA